MTKFARLGFSALLLCSASMAAALPYTATDTVDPAQLGVIRSAFGTTPALNYTFTHDLTDNGYMPGHSLLDALLTLTLTDNDGIGGQPSVGEGGSEWAQVSFDLGSVLNFTQQVQSPNVFTFNFDTGEIVSGTTSQGTYASLLSVMTSIQADGKLSVTLSALQQGNGQASGYFFDSSVLAITADDGVQPPIPAPEPAALSLLGLGLAAIGFSRRSKKRA